MPFGVYLGRISVATIANISTYLVDTGRGMRGMSEIFRTVIVLIVATALGIIQLRRSANIPFALVLLWAFFGIVSKRLAVDPVSASTIIWTIARCSLLLSGFI